MSDGKNKRKKEKAQDNTYETDETDDQMSAIIIRLSKEVENLKAAFEKAQRIRKKDPPAPPDIHAFDNNVDTMDTQSTTRIDRQQPTPTTSTSVVGGEKGIVSIHVDPKKLKFLYKVAFSPADM